MVNSVVWQKRTYDCGIVCIATLLEYYEIQYNYDELLDMVEDRKNGSSMMQIKEILRSYGIDVNGYKIEEKDYQKDDWRTPIIAHLCMCENTYHFIVIFVWRE